MFLCIENIYGSISFVTLSFSCSFSSELANPSFSLPHPVYFCPPSLWLPAVILYILAVLLFIPLSFPVPLSLVSRLVSLITAAQGLEAVDIHSKQQVMD